MRKVNCLWVWSLACFFLRISLVLIRRSTRTWSRSSDPRCRSWASPLQKSWVSRKSDSSKQLAHKLVPCHFTDTFKCINSLSITFNLLCIRFCPYSDLSVSVFQGFCEFDGFLPLCSLYSVPSCVKIMGLINEAILNEFVFGWWDEVCFCLTAQHRLYNRSRCFWRAQTWTNCICPITIRYIHFAGFLQVIQRINVPFHK